MKIACIDDIPEEGEQLLSMVKNQFSKYKIDVSETDYFSTGNSFFKTWHPGMYRMIFLDIYLDNEDGIEIAKSIRKIDYKVPIIFCSSSNAFASESYEVQANYYLVKPVSADDIKRMIHHLNLLRTNEDMIELPNHRMLLLSQFIYSDYHNHLITIYLKNGQTERLWSSQADFLEKLEPFSYFLSVTPGTVVNLKEVGDFKDDCFYMKDGSIVPVSKRKKKQLMNSYKNFLFAELRRD